jgi:hypothetical protein
MAPRCRPPRGRHGSLAYELAVGLLGLAAGRTVAHGAEAVVPAYAMSRMAKTEIVDIPQPYKSIVLIDVVVDETPYEVAIDQSPYLGINDECAERCLLYLSGTIALRGTRTTTSCRAASLR